ncbi:MAG: hypothetical protein M5U19_00590 [Microthrixaceae bacterium]|nr:hypothetical protein [Microthrixaceae bacterium]
MRLGAASAMFVWMVEGTLVLTSLVVTDKIELARFAAYVRLSVVTSIAGVTVSTVATSSWSKVVRSGGSAPGLRGALRWSALGATAAAAAGGVLLLVADHALRLPRRVLRLLCHCHGRIVLKDVAVACGLADLLLPGHEGALEGGGPSGTHRSRRLAPGAGGGAVRWVTWRIDRGCGGWSVWLSSYLYYSVRVDDHDDRG